MLKVCYILRLRQSTNGRYFADPILQDAEVSTWKSAEIEKRDTSWQSHGFIFLFYFPGQ